MYWCLRFHYLNIAVLIILLLRILSDYPSSSWWVLFLFHISQSQNHVRNFPETTNYWHTDWNCYWLANWLTNLFINSQTHWLSDGRSITQTSLFFPKRSFPQGKHSPAIVSEWPDYLPAFCDLFGQDDVFLKSCLLLWYCQHVFRRWNNPHLVDDSNEFTPTWWVR